jgi:hypothetical protein
MNFATAGVKGGIMTPNEARNYMNLPSMEGADELMADGKDAEPVPGASGQDTGGGGGNQTRKMNIGTT